MSRLEPPEAESVTALRPDSPSRRCRSCQSTDLADLLDLGTQPPAGTFPTPAEATSLETWPLVAAVCRGCWLVQLVDPVPEEPAADAVHPTMSSTMAAHAEQFVSEILGGGTSPQPRIAEVASHGGHLAPRFAAQGVRTLVVDPSPALIASARAAGLEAETSDLTPGDAARIRERLGASDIVVDNYLLAHQRTLDPQLGAMATLLGPAGRAVIEFNHVLPMLTGMQFDAIRHGHFTYLSLTSLVPALERHELYPVRATAQPVYGGGIRLWVARSRPTHPDPGLAHLLAAESDAGMTDESLYQRFGAGVDQSRSLLRQFLDDAKGEGRLVVGYGAPSRGSTLLNACGITAALLPYTVDASRDKHGRLMPGSGVPIADPARIIHDRPDDVLVLTWDIADEIVAQLSEIRSWGGRFVIPLPSLSFR